MNENEKNLSGYGFSFKDYIKILENPDKIGLNNGIWSAPILKGYDKNQRGYGIDINTNKKAKALTNNRPGRWLTEKEADTLMDDHINYITEAANKHIKGFSELPFRRKWALLGMLYRGDSVNKSGININEPDDLKFFKSISDYYRSKGLNARANSSDEFFNRPVSKLLSMFKLKNGGYIRKMQTAAGGPIYEKDWSDELEPYAAGIGLAGDVVGLGTAATGVGIPVGTAIAGFANIPNLIIDGYQTARDTWRSFNDGGNSLGSAAWNGGEFILDATGLKALQYINKAQRAGVKAEQIINSMERKATHPYKRVGTGASRSRLRKSAENKKSYNAGRNKALKESTNTLAKKGVREAQGEYFRRKLADEMAKRGYGVAVNDAIKSANRTIRQNLAAVSTVSGGTNIYHLLPKHKNGGLIRKMLTAAGGPLRIKFDPERIARLEYLMTRVPGTNNSKGDRYRKEGILALQHLELEAKRKELEILSRMEMRPTLKRKAEKLGDKDEYEQVPLVVGMSGTDPVGEFILTGIGLNGVGALAKTGLWNVAKYTPKTWLGNWGRGYFVGNVFKNSFNGTKDLSKLLAFDLFQKLTSAPTSKITKLRPEFSLAMQDRDYVFGRLLWSTNLTKDGYTTSLTKHIKVMDTKQADPQIYVTQSLYPLAIENGGLRATREGQTRPIWLNSNKPYFGTPTGESNSTNYTYVINANKFTPELNLLRNIGEAHYEYPGTMQLPIEGTKRILWDPVLQQYTSTIFTDASKLGSYNIDTQTLKLNPKSLYKFFKKQGGKMNILEFLKKGGQIRKMLTASGGPIKKPIKRLKDGYRYIPDEKNGGWDRISDNSMADVFATMEFTPKKTKVGSSITRKQSVPSKIYYNAYNSDNIMDAIRRRLYRNITPFGYHNPISRTSGAIALNQQDDTRTEENKRIKDSVPEASALDALWATYLNIPENQRRNINPKYGISKTKNGYYRFNSPGMIFNFEQDLSPHGLFELPGRKAVMMNGILGNYTTGLGRDTKGDYIFYSDSKLNPDGTPNIKTGWDINPYSNTVDNDTEETTEEYGQYGQDKKDLSYKIGKALFGNVEDISMGLGTPVPIYDKIYLDDIYNVSGKERGGYYLPEITVTRKKK